jgi:hypothetical protein
MAHPLSDFVMSAFTPEKRHHDRITIACLVAGATAIRIPNSKKNGMDAYVLVAEERAGLSGGSRQITSGHRRLVRGEGCFVRSV